MRGRGRASDERRCPRRLSPAGGPGQRWCAGLGEDGLLTVGLATDRQTDGLTEGRGAGKRD